MGGHCHLRDHHHLQLSIQPQQHHHHVPSSYQYPTSLAPSASSISPGLPSPPNPTNSHHRTTSLCPSIRQTSVPSFCIYPTLSNFFLLGRSVPLSSNANINAARRLCRTSRVHHITHREGAQVSPSGYRRGFRSYSNRSGRRSSIYRTRNPQITTITIYFRCGIRLGIRSILMDRTASNRRYFPTPRMVDSPSLTFCMGMPRAWNW